MTRFLRSFFVFFDREDFQSGVPCKGFDEGIEEMVTKWKHAIPSCTKDGFDIGNFIQTFSEDSRTSLRSKIDPSELKSFTKSLTAYFNFHESARLSENLTEFRSFNNNEIKSQLPTLAASKFY
jgi:hypothetical protein